MLKRRFLHIFLCGMLIKKTVQIGVTRISVPLDNENGQQSWLSTTLDNIDSLKCRWCTVVRRLFVRMRAMADPGFGFGGQVERRRRKNRGAADECPLPEIFFKVLGREMRILMHSRTFSVLNCFCTVCNMSRHRVGQHSLAFQPHSALIKARR